MVILISLSVYPPTNLCIYHLPVIYSFYRFYLSLGHPIYLSLYPSLNKDDDDPDDNRDEGERDDYQDGDDQKDYQDGDDQKDRNNVN